MIAGARAAKVNKEKRMERNKTTFFGVNFTGLIDTISMYLIGFLLYNYARLNVVAFNVCLAFFIFYNLYRFFVWYQFPKDLSPEGMQNMTMASFMKFQENFINKNAKLKGEEIEIKRFVTDFGLEVEIRKPKDSIKIKCKTAILLTHPWSVLGGDMDNNVPETLCKAFAHAGYYVVRFNFRGVGKSKGRCTCRASGERKDVLKIVDMLTGNDKIKNSKECKQYAKLGIPKLKRVLLVGYSYGSMITNSCVRMRKEIIGYVSVSCPFPVIWFLSCFNTRNLWEGMLTVKPKLFLCGTDDDFTSESSFSDYIMQMPKFNRRSVMIEEINHGWWKKEVALGGLILSWMRKTWKMEAKFQGHLIKASPQADEIEDDIEEEVVDGDVDNVTLKKKN